MCIVVVLVVSSLLIRRYGSVIGLVSFFNETIEAFLLYRRNIVLELAIVVEDVKRTSNNPLVGLLVSPGRYARCRQ